MDGPEEPDGAVLERDVSSEAFARKRRLPVLEYPGRLFRRSGSAGASFLCIFDRRCLREEVAVCRMLPAVRDTFTMATGSRHTKLTTTVADGKSRRHNSATFIDILHCCGQMTLHMFSSKPSESGASTRGPFWPDDACMWSTRRSEETAEQSDRLKLQVWFYARPIDITKLHTSKLLSRVNELIEDGQTYS